MKKTEYMKDGEKFFKIFGRNLNNYCGILYTGDLYFDVIKFEELLIENGYDENGDKSMKEFIEEKYGTEAQEFIAHLLD